MASKVSSNVPNLSNRLQRAIDLTVQEVAAKVVEYAQATAPVDNGFYKGAIAFDGRDKVIANIEYSAAIEYGVDKTFPVKEHPRLVKGEYQTVKAHDRTVLRSPNPVMRNAQKKAQKKVEAIFKKNFERAS